MCDRVCPLLNGPGRDQTRPACPGEGTAVAVKSLRRSCLLAVNLAEVLEKCSPGDKGVNRVLMELLENCHVWESWFVEPNANDASGQRTLPGAKSRPETGHIR